MIIIKLNVQSIITCLKSLKFPFFSCRLFLTCEITPKLPVNLLRAGRIITFEPPPGVRANLLRTFATIPPARMMRPPNERARLYFILAWFHAVIQVCNVLLFTRIRGQFNYLLVFQIWISSSFLCQQNYHLHFRSVCVTAHWAGPSRTSSTSPTWESRVTPWTLGLMRHPWEERTCLQVIYIKADLLSCHINYKIESIKLL